MNMEIWKDIPCYEGFYKISNKGRVLSLSRHGVKVDRILKNRISHGYLNVILYKNKNKKMHLIHRLIAISFITNPENKPQINHKNGIRTDNSIDNLEWTTQSENMLHAYKIGLQKFHGKPMPRGENCCRSKLTDLQVNEIRNKYKKGQIRYIDLAKEYKVSDRQIGYIINNKSRITI